MSLSCTIYKPTLLPLKLLIKRCHSFQPECLHGAERCGMSGGLWSQACMAPAVRVAVNWCHYCGGEGIEGGIGGERGNYLWPRVTGVHKGSMPAREISRAAVWWLRMDTHTHTKRRINTLLMGSPKPLTNSHLQPKPTPIPYVPFLFFSISPTPTPNPYLGITNKFFFRFVLKNKNNLCNRLDLQQQKDSLKVKSKEINLHVFMNMLLCFHFG